MQKRITGFIDGERPVGFAHELENAGTYFVGMLAAWERPVLPKEIRLFETAVSENFV